jgi:hypothetical protein
VKRKTMSFQETITSFIDHLNNSFDQTIKTPCGPFALSGQAREILFTQASNERKSLLELRKYLIWKELDSKIEFIPEFKKPVEHVILCPSRIISPEIEIVKQVQVIPREVKVVTVKKEEAQKKPSGIQPYDAKNEVEKRVFESIKKFATRDYTISSYTLSEFRNMSDEEKKKLGYSEKELLEDMEEDFEA